MNGLSQNKFIRFNKWPGITVVLIFLQGCASFNKEIIDFEPNKPVQVKEKLIGRSYTQEFQKFNFHQMIDHFQSNEATKNTIGYYYSTAVVTVIMAVGGGLIARPNFSKESNALGIGMLGTAIYLGYSLDKRTLDAVNIHNSKFGTSSKVFLGPTLTFNLLEL